MRSRFDYVQFDDIAIEQQRALRAAFTSVEAGVYALSSSATRQLAFNALEIAYMWIGKAIRNEQIARLEAKEKL